MAASPLVVLVDVDSLCSELKGRVGRELVDTLRMLAAADAQILLVSRHAYELAAALNLDLERAWWCDRTTGWHDGVPEHGTRTTMSFALVLCQLRGRLRDARVLALSNDPCLWAALDRNDRIIVFGHVPHRAPIDISVTTDHLIDAMWCVIDIRTHYRRFKR